VSIVVGIYVYDEVEALDLAGPYEAFTTATRMHARAHPDSPALFQVITLALTHAAVRARAGLQVLPDFSIGSHPAIDLLLLPGGVVTDEVLNDDLTSWIQRVSSTTRITASVCTGAFLLAQAGLLDGLNATTHWEDVDDLVNAYPTVNVNTGMRWVDEGAIVTSAGISAGIDMSLHLVERLAGRELALRTARQMNVVWTELS
jgi:transcriptional regulator GlxA family with amidase domain